MRQWVARRHAVNELGRDLANRSGGKETAKKARDDETGALSDNVKKHSGSRRTERHAYPDLVCSLRHDVGDEAIHADGCQQDGDACETGDEERVQTRPCENAGDVLLDRSGCRCRLRWVRFVDSATDGGYGPKRLPRRAKNEISDV